MPPVTIVGKADLALASGVSGVLKAAGGTLADAVANTDYAPPDSPTITNTITQNTAASGAYVRHVSNTQSGVVTSAPWGESYTGFLDVPSGVIDNAFMQGWLRELKVAGQPAQWWQEESRWVPGEAPGGYAEYHRNYISIDGTVEYRPEGGFINLNDHSSEYTYRNLFSFRLLGFGIGIGDPSPPSVTWNGVSGAMNATGGINAASFSGSGALLTGLDATALAGGTLPDARFPSFLDVDSSNNLLGVRVTDMTDPISGNDVFKVGAGTNQYLGYQGGWLSLQDGTHKGRWQPNGIGTFNNESFAIFTNSATTATFGVDGSLTTTGSLTTPGFVTTATTIKANAAGVYPLTFGALSGSGSYPGLWATTATPTLSNYVMQVDGPGGGLVFQQPSYVAMQSGSCQLAIVPTGATLSSGTLAVSGPITATTGTLTGQFSAMGGNLKTTIGTITGSEAFSGVWFTNGTRTITNYAFLGKADTTLLNVATGGVLGLMVNNTFKVQANDTGLGFFGGTPAAKPTVTGSRGGNAALASLLTALAGLGLITDSSSA